MPRVWLAFALVLAVASAATAQFGLRQTARFPTKDTFGHGFNFCRGVYTSGRREA